MYSLRSIHKLYLILKHCLPEKEHELLLDELESMLDRAEPGTIVKSLEIMFPKKDLSKNSHAELFDMFMQGLTKSNFFEYSHFINGIKT